MTRLNLKHLRYFVEVARRGSISAAARALFVTPQTVSGQIQALEAFIGQPLFERSGRRLVLTAAGTTALEYATGIFALGDELHAVLRGGSRPKSELLRVGVTDSVPKLLTVRLLQPLLARHPDRIELVCHEGTMPELLGRIGAGELDMMLADTAVPASFARVLRARLLAESGVSFVAAPPLTARLSRRFPNSLDGAPFLAGSAASSLLEQSIEGWFARHDLHPRIVGRIDDSALLKGFAQAGLGIAAVPTSIERDVARQYGLKVVGRTDEIRSPVFLIRARNRRPHALVAELEEGNRDASTA